MAKTPEQQWVEGLNERTAEWWKAMTKGMKDVPPPGMENMDDRLFFERHRQKAEWWAAQGDPNYIAALALTAPEEAERFAKVGKEIAAEEAIRRYAR